MPKRLVLQTITLHVNGESVRPKIGSIYDFKQEDYDWLMKNAPESIGKPTDKVTQDGVTGGDDGDRQKLKDELRAEILREQEEAVKAEADKKPETAAQKKTREAAEAKAAADENKSEDDI